MKYWIVEDPTDENRHERLFSRVTALRAYLREHPEIQFAYRYWVYRDDLIECEKISREELIGCTVRQLSAGETMQWAAAHGRL